MVTLRERSTQYGIIINLPYDHTATSVNTAVTEAFARSCRVLCVGTRLLMRCPASLSPATLLQGMQRSGLAG